MSNSVVVKPSPLRCFLAAAGASGYGVFVAVQRDGAASLVGLLFVALAVWAGLQAFRRPILVADDLGFHFRGRLVPFASLERCYLDGSTIQTFPRSGVAEQFDLGWVPSRDLERLRRLVLEHFPFEGAA